MGAFALRRRGSKDYCDARCGKRHGGEKTETSRVTMRSITDWTEKLAGLLTELCRGSERGDLPRGRQVAIGDVDVDVAHGAYSRPRSPGVFVGRYGLRKLIYVSAGVCKVIQVLVLQTTASCACAADSKAASNRNTGSRTKVFLIAANDAAFAFPAVVIIEEREPRWTEMMNIQIKSLLVCRPFVSKGEP
jgi:hypothetical protein